MVLLHSGSAVGRLALGDERLKARSTEVLRDLTSAEEAARPFFETSDWRVLYESDPVRVWQSTSASLESMYQQIHRLRRGSLARLLGVRWLDALATSPSYRWTTAQTDALSNDDVGDSRVAARALAWLDGACTVRNKVVQHREKVEQVGYVVEPTSFSAVYRTSTVELDESVRLFDKARTKYSLTLHATNAPEVVSYLASLSEQLYCVEPEFSDEMRRAIIRSGLYVLLGSQAFVRNWDNVVATLVRERF